MKTTTKAIVVALAVGAMGATVAGGVQAGPAQDVARILAAGLDAEGRQDGPALLENAQALQRSGAHSDGGDDLARAWIREAIHLGVDPGPDQIWRGRTLGPAYRNGRVIGHGVFRTRQTFNAGEKADIAVVPTQGGALGLDVEDGDGKSICSVGPSTRDLGCDWVPAFTGGSAIAVHNDAEDAQSFYIVLN